MKCPGRATPTAWKPSRRATSIHRMERLMGMPRLRAMTLGMTALAGSS